MGDVMLVRWPEEGDDGARLAHTGMAVLYLIDGDDDPPTPTTCLEDWIRVPGDERDLRARVSALEFRSLAHQGPPRVDDAGRLHYLGKTRALPPDAVHLARALTEHFGEVVQDGDLEQATGDERTVRTRMTELRASLRDLELSVRRVRRRGYTLQRR
jgi:DNA-binding response OmpR family regulator